MITFWLSFFDPRAPKFIVYMLQQVEYDVSDFGTWLKRLEPLYKTKTRKELVYTKIAKVLLIAGYVGWAVGIGLITYSVLNVLLIGILIALALFPVIVLMGPIAIILPGRIYKMKQISSLTQQASEVFSDTKAVKIAIIGSYGKTTTKEFLSVILSEKMNVVMTPGNKNVIESQARWAIRALDENTDIAIVEFGEYRPGDIAAMAEMVRPDYAVITGYAPNHLDSYGSEEALKKDLASITSYVTSDKLFVSADVVKMLDIQTCITYGSHTVLGWRISNSTVGYEGTAFTITKGKTSKDFSVDVLGAHLVPTIVLCIAIAHEKFAASWDDIARGLTKIKPYPHRMQPLLVNGAWIIDDTYNGNLEGIRAGLELLKTLPAKRKIYVTPGLVEQGDRTQAVHQEIGLLLAEANPDKIVLMKNSVTSIIKQSLVDHGYKGDVQIESSPLHFYENIEYSVASGDLVLMQNDWTDNYS